MDAQVLASFIELQARLPRAGLLELMAETPPGETPESFISKHTITTSKGAGRLGAKLARSGARVVCWFEASYPQRIRALMGQSAPPLLYYAGSLSHLHPPAISIIGTRRATGVGLDAAAAYAREIVARGCVVISGNAPGIDSAAHAAALQEGGVTVVCPPAPLDQYEPTFKSESVPERILVLSPFLPGSSIQPWNFLARNELVAAHGGAHIVAETGLTGGTHNTIGHIRRFSRPFFCVDIPAGNRYHAAHEQIARAGDKPLPIMPTPAAMDEILHAARKPIALQPVHPDLFS